MHSEIASAVFANFCTHSGSAHDDKSNRDAFSEVLFLCKNVRDIHKYTNTQHTSERHSESSRHYRETTRAACRLDLTLAIVSYIRISYHDKTAYNILNRVSNNNHFGGLKYGPVWSIKGWFETNVICFVGWLPPPRPLATKIHALRSMESILGINNTVANYPLLAQCSILSWVNP